MNPYYSTPNGKLYCGDCLQIMPELEPVDLTITSPPYDNLRNYKGYKFEFENMANELFRVTKKGGVVIWVVNDATIKGSETGTSFKQALYFKDTGFNIHDTMIYKKLNYVPLTHNRYEQSFEYMFVFSKGTPNIFNPIKIPCKYPGKVEKYGLNRRQNHGKNHSMRLYKNTELKATKVTKISPNIFEYTLGREKTGHPAPFPEKLANDHIISWSNEHDTIFDPMAGSGTTLKMAEQLNRKWIGCETSEEYCEMIAKRVEQERKQRKMF